MIKRKLSKYLMLIGAMILVIAVVVPSVAAYEGHLIDIKAHDTIPATKVARLATQGEIAYAKNTLHADICFDTNTVTAWDRIPKETCVAWIVTISVTNHRDYAMNNVTVYDEFNDNVEIKVMSKSPGTTVNIQNENRVDLWNVGNLQPDEKACLTLIVWTKCEWVCVSSSSPSPSLNLSCGLFNLFYGLFNKGSDCPPPDCHWKCKTLKKTDGKYYLQAYNPCNPCPKCGPCPPCKPTGILMKWYDTENQEWDSYTGGPLLEITVY